MGSYVVQPLTVNGKPRSLPTFGVITESRETLSELIKTTLNLLSAASSYKYSVQDLIKKIDFVMNDERAI